MSEYQFYEFATLDAPLSDEGMAYAQSVTSRAEITPWRWRNVYNWSDFRGSVEKMMQFYDAHVYIANWGSFRFKLALPQGCIDRTAIEPYLTELSLDLTECGDRYVVTWFKDSEGDGGWVDGEGILDLLTPIRDELLRGDLRSLYAGWLADLCSRVYDDESAEEYGSELEPPVPPGLGALSPSQVELAEQLDVDGDYLAAAAALDVPEIDTAAALRQALSELKDEDARELLLRVANGEGARVMAELNWLATRHTRGDTGPRRRLREIAEAANGKLHERELREAEAREQERQEQEAKRRAHLEDLLARSAEIWHGFGSLAERKNASAYDEISQQIHDLAEAYELADRTQEFETKLTAFRAVYSRRPALMRRLEDLS